MYFKKFVECIIILGVPLPPNSQMNQPNQSYIFYLIKEKALFHSNSLLVITGRWRMLHVSSWGSGDWVLDFFCTLLFSFLFFGFFFLLFNFSLPSIQTCKHYLIVLEKLHRRFSEPEKIPNDNFQDILADCFMYELGIQIVVLPR